MGGFECSTHRNGAGTRLDLIASIQHDLHAAEDYAMLRTVGMETARDGVRWHLVDRGGHYDFSSFVPVLEGALRNGVQVIWDLFHYGFPDDLDLFEPEFVDRFARYARAVARIFADHTDDVPFWAPVNEISFFAWAASRKLIFPCAKECDDAIKFQLVRAAIAAAEALWDVDPRARLVYPEPIFNVVAREDRPDWQQIARMDNESQFEAWDMLAGRRYPQLGGALKYLDIMGANFYSTNQWEQLQERKALRWKPNDRDPRWTPLDQLLWRVYRRYRRPLFIAETGHIGVGRAGWLREVTYEAQRAMMNGLPLEGICLYPVIDRHDWDDPNHWHNSGLWDLERGPDGKIRRVLNTEYAEELRRSQALLRETQELTSTSAR